MKALWSGPQCKHGLSHNSGNNILRKPHMLKDWCLLKSQIRAIFSQTWVGAQSYGASHKVRLRKKQAAWRTYLICSKSHRSEAFSQQTHQGFRRFSLKGSRRDLFSQAFHHSFNAAVLHSRSLDTQFAQMRILGLNLMLVNVFIFRISWFYLEFGCYRVCSFWHQIQETVAATNRIHSLTQLLHLRRKKPIIPGHWMLLRWTETTYNQCI